MVKIMPSILVNFELALRYKMKKSFEVFIFLLNFERMIANKDHLKN